MVSRINDHAPKTDLHPDSIAPLLEVLERIHDHLGGIHDKLERLLVLTTPPPAEPAPEPTTTEPAQPQGSGA